jgi:hypothetical protein
MRVVHIAGGLPGDNPRCATVDGIEFTRGADETTAAFEARVTAKAKESGAKRVVIGGLPDREI